MCLGEFCPRDIGANTYKSSLWSVNTCVCFTLHNTLSISSNVWATAYASFSYMFQFLWAPVNFSPRNRSSSWCCCSNRFPIFNPSVSVSTAAHISSDVPVYTHTTCFGLENAILTAICGLFRTAFSAALCLVPRDWTWSVMILNALFLCLPAQLYLFSTFSLSVWILLWNSGIELPIHQQQ